MKCPVCGVRDPEVGVLCEECRDELSSPIRITPEQIILRIVRPTEAALLDPWGRVHRLEARTIVGRQIEAQGLAILEPSVSRHHAHLTLDDGVWTLRDLGSANGTFHDDKLIEGAVTVNSGDRVRFGHIAFYIIGNVEKLPPPRVTRTVTSTIKPPNLPAELPAIANKDFQEEEENTNVGLPEMRFRMHEPTGGGGGLIEVDGKQVQLTTTQFELMALMIRRMAAEEHQPELVRGFVRSSELIADLSWDTREPSENHVKQLVRRVRRALIKCDIGDLIESRHRFGYRLRAIPKADPPKN
jgi:pSer/pThr/pTyr-binding forkhead associated (FHA) protein